MQSMALAHDEQWLICSFQEGNIAFINTKDFTVQISDPFGEIENIYNTKVLETQNSGEQRVVFASSNGCLKGSLSKDGSFQAEKTYFEGCNVSNVEKVKGEEVIVTFNTEEGISKLYTINTGTDETELVID